MKKIIHLLIGIIGAVFFVISVQTEVKASQGNTTMTLYSGRAYEFVNTDPNSTMFVSFIGNNVVSYDFVMKDQSGDIVGFGISGGRIQIRNGGTTTVTMTNRASVQVSYNASRLKVIDTSGSALWRENIAGSQTISIQNNSSERSAEFSIDNTGRSAYARYDLVIRDNTGIVTHYSANNIFTSIIVPSGGSAMLTAIGDAGMRLMAPADTINNMVTIKKDNTPALAFRVIEGGKTVAITNGGFSDYQLRVSSVAGTVSNIQYDFVNLDGRNFVTDFNQASAGLLINILVDNTFVITPTSAIRLTFPSEWAQNGLTIAERQTEALTSFNIPGGKTFTLTNTSMSTVLNLRAVPAAITGRG
ncbi:MAG: hypothetical protein FWE82_08820, partial [Defluviitaleaceae bacterium]|nr:hypothetical protein [Defluviitaleaceae bacterium]